MRKLLLLSNSTQHGSSFLAYCSENIKQYFSKYDVSQILFIPYAAADYSAYAQKAKAAFQEMGIEMDSIHEASNPAEAVKQAHAIFIGGGNTFRLLKTLYDKNLVSLISERVLKDGMPYMGASAGTNVATVSICTTNDMPIVFPPSFKALGLVPFNINPHFTDSDPQSTHMGETRETRINEYHETPDSPPVLGLREGCILLVEGDMAVLTGLTGAKLFIRGKEPTEYGGGSDMSFLLK